MVSTSLTMVEMVDSERPWKIIMFFVSTCSAVFMSSHRPVEMLASCKSSFISTVSSASCMQPSKHTGEVDSPRVLIFADEDDEA